MAQSLGVNCVLTNQKDDAKLGYIEYFNTNMRIPDTATKKSKTEKEADPISRQVSLVMTYEKLYTRPFNDTLETYNNLNEYTISFDLYKCLVSRTTSNSFLKSGCNVPWNCGCGVNAPL